MCVLPPYVCLSRARGCARALILRKCTVARFRASAFVFVVRLPYLVLWPRKEKEGGRERRSDRDVRPSTGQVLNEGFAIDNTSENPHKLSGVSQMGKEEKRMDSNGHQLRRQISTIIHTRVVVLASGR